MDRIVDAARNLDRQPEQFSRMPGSSMMAAEESRYGGRHEPYGYGGERHYFEAAPMMGSYGGGGR
jgi:hypothetical protein